MICKSFVYRYRIYAVLILAFCHIQASGQKLTPEEYIGRYSGEAVRQMKASGIPASITLAQGGLESGWGGSELAVNARNHFGIKCHGWDGGTYRKNSGADKDCYRKYKSVEESFRDHSDFLKYRERYAFLFDLEPTDYKGWARGLQKAGYSTNPQYATLLINLIEKYSLYRFDENSDRQVKRAESLPAVPSGSAAVGVLCQPAALKSSIFYKYSQGHSIYETNGVVCIFSSDGDTYESIAREYDLFAKELLAFNDLKHYEGVIPTGTRIYLQRKKKEAAGHIGIHIAGRGDTYYELSQRYGVRLSCIYKYNGVKDGDIPAEGENVLLRKRKKMK